MQWDRNSLIFCFLICFLAKTNAQNTPADSIYSSTKSKYYNLLFPYIFDENQMNKTYFLMLGNHFIKYYDKNNFLPFSKNDGPLVGLDSIITKKEADKLYAKMKKEKELECTKPDKARIEAQNKAEDKLKTKN